MSVAESSSGSEHRLPRLTIVSSSELPSSDRPPLPTTPERVNDTLRTVRHEVLDAFQGLGMQRSEVKFLSPDGAEITNQEAIDLLVLAETLSVLKRREKIRKTAVVNEDVHEGVFAAVQRSDTPINMRDPHLGEAACMNFVDRMLNGMGLPHDVTVRSGEPVVTVATRQILQALREHPVFSTDPDKELLEQSRIGLGIVTQIVNTRNVA